MDELADLPDVAARRRAHHDLMTTPQTHASLEPHPQAFRITPRGRAARRISLGLVVAAGCWIASAGQGGVPAAAETVSPDTSMVADTTLDLDPILIPGNPVSPDDPTAADTTLELDPILIPGNPVYATEPFVWLWPRSAFDSSWSSDVLQPDDPSLSELLRPDGPPILPEDVIETGDLDASDVFRPDGPPIAEPLAPDDPSFVEAVG